MVRRLVPVLVPALLTVGLVACASPEAAAPPAPPVPSRPISPSPATSAPVDPSPPPTPSGPAYSTWVLGSQELPLRADGYGEVRATPPSLRVRRYRTVDVLPPPADGTFRASTGPITDALRARIGETWQPGCPVPLADLRYVTVGFRGFDGAAHTGELVVAATEAADVISVFRALFRAGYPIEEMRLPTTADLDAPPTGDGNNTAAMVCRPTTGSTTTLSAHAYGLAIDVNPFVNPYERGDLVLPELASSYLDRTWRRPGMHADGSVAVREFARIGWSWGGDFESLKDYHHFTATGR